MDSAGIKDRILNEEQKKAVEFGDGPLLIIAGAGTGKTTVITERITYLISSGRAKHQEILALTFTEKASREMEERVDMTLPYGMTQMWISTFHAFCDRVLRAEGLAIGLDPNYKLMTEAETIQFFQKNIFHFELSYFRPLGNPKKFISGMVQHFSRLKDEDVTPRQYIEWVNTKCQTSPPVMQMSKVKSRTKNNKEEEIEDVKKYKELANAYRTYEELKTKNGVMDYGDLISYTLRLFRTRVSILKRYQEQFKYLLIDEFQDTNYAQNELSILLAGKKQNITVVGDDDQAIYRWRGAAISNIIQFRKHFPKANIIVLTKNYRSTKEILDKSYQLIQHNNPDRLEVVEKIDKKLECVRRIHGNPIEFICADRVEDEAEKTAKKIISLVKSADTKNSYAWKDVAILVRANTHADPFIRALSRNAIPYQFLGPGQLFRQPEVKDLICYLKVLYDINDTVSLFRVLSMDHFQIAARDISWLISYARQKGISLFEACEQLIRKSEDMTDHITEDGINKIVLITTFILKHLSFLKKETAGQILYFFLEESGLLQTFTSYKTQKDERAAENIAKFFDKLKTYEASHEDASVFSVVDWLDLSMDLGESPLAANTDWNSYNAVNILTVHSAKGLEFPIVFLVNLVGARFPTTEKREQIPIPDGLVKELLPEGDYHLEEERRLCYVGMTRARDLLYLTAARYYGDGKREKKISPFVIEILGKDLANQLKDLPPDEERQLSFLDWQKKDIEPSKKPESHSVTYISYSQYESFKRCPLQYRYRHIVKIPVAPSAALSFGDTIHRTLKEFYEHITFHKKPTRDMLLDCYMRQWKSVGFKDKEYEETMKQHGILLLEEYFQKGFDPKTVVLTLEQPFKIRIHPHLHIGGKIDRVDRREDGTLEIIDYKTGSAPKNRNPEDDIQLSVYALAAADPGLYGEKPEHITVSFYFLEGQEKISAKRTLKQLKEVRKEIQQTADNISSSSFSPTPGKHCDFCEFRLICEAWR